jgi:HSP20 family protein
MATRDTGLSRRNGDLVRLDPWNELHDMRRTMDEMFGRFFGYTPMSRFIGNALPEAWSNWQPNVDLYETPEEFVFRADLPGFDMKDIDIQLTSDTLSINARHAEDTSPNPQPGLPESASQANESPSPTQGSAGNAPAAPGQTGLAKTGQPQHPQTYHIRNRQRQSFSVSYTLPREIDPEKSAASYQNGVLELHMPKPEQAKPKQVQVKVQGS